MTFIKIDMNLITKCNPRDKCKFPSFSSQVNNNNNHRHLHHSNNNNKNNATTTTTTASITDDSLSGGNLLRARNWDLKSPYDDGEKNLTNLHI